MKFAIIAAGEGSRLAREGVKEPKPLIKLQGIPIIERLVMLFASHSAESINIIINSVFHIFQFILHKHKCTALIILSCCCVSARVC